MHSHIGCDQKEITPRQHTQRSKIGSIKLHGTRQPPQHHTNQRGRSSDKDTHLWWWSRSPYSRSSPAPPPSPSLSLRHRANQRVGTPEYEDTGLHSCKCGKTRTGQTARDGVFVEAWMAEGTRLAAFNHMGNGANLPCPSRSDQRFRNSRSVATWTQRNRGTEEHASS
jgi:hypothetical protein